MDVKREDVKREELRPVKEITLLDPACGTMHFGLVAFDLFAAMYREEINRAGQPGWPKAPSVSDPAEIPAAIIAHNLFGMDIDLRAVQLSALALYLKAKSLNPKARIADSNLACADVLPLDGARLGTFLREARFTQPIYERLIRALWARLRHVNQLGSLLRLEQELGGLIAEERARYQKAPLFVGMAEEFEVVVTNPPYSGKRNLNETLAGYLDSDYPDAKGDLYTAFIQRCAELVAEGGRLGMITQQSFMFLSSYEKLRAYLRDTFAIETMVHTGPHAFAEITGEKVNTTVFALRAEPETLVRENSVGAYFRLVNAPGGDGKRQVFEQALTALRS